MKLTLAHQIIGLIVIVGICFAVAAIGGGSTAPSIPNWYAGLKKPSWTPPSWVFGPVWSFLYLAMGIAAWLVWRQGLVSQIALPLTLFGVQLALNLAWSLIFFGMQRPGAAFVDIVLLWLAIVATTITFWRVSTAAGILMLPYILWVTYASTLNWGIWRMNR